jgi:hypothetical protein
MATPNGLFAPIFLLTCFFKLTDTKMLAEVSVLCYYYHGKCFYKGG